MIEMPHYFVAGGETIWSIQQYVDQERRTFPHLGRLGNGRHSDATAIASSSGDAPIGTVITKQFGRRMGWSNGDSRNGVGKQRDQNVQSGS